MLMGVVITSLIPKPLLDLCERSAYSQGNQLRYSLHRRLGGLQIQSGHFDF